MYSTFVGACLAGVAMSLKIRSGLQLPESKPMSFAQTGAPVPVDICQRTATMNKEDVPDFYALYAGSSAFDDTSFPHTSANIFAWADANEKDELEGDTVVWKRAKDAFPDHTLYGSNGVTPQDLR